MQRRKCDGLSQPKIINRREQQQEENRTYSVHAPIQAKYKPSEIHLTRQHQDSQQCQAKRSPAGRLV
jgi:hypothetical protein